MLMCRKWPPSGPYWETGIAADSATIIVAYIRYDDDLYEYWPEARDTTWQDRDELTFTDRFRQPEWWPTEEA